jgi:hypothetical protein
LNFVLHTSYHRCEALDEDAIQVGSYIFTTGEEVDDEVGDENQSIVDQLESEPWYVNKYGDTNSLKYLHLGGQSPSWLFDEQQQLMLSHKRIKDIYAYCKEFEGVMLRNKDAKVLSSLFLFYF